MKTIEIYAWSWCPYCIAAKRLLAKKGLDYEEHDATQSEVAAVMQQRSDRSSVPQIFLDGMHLGGYDDLATLERTGKFDQLLGDTKSLTNGESKSAGTSVDNRESKAVSA